MYDTYLKDVIVVEAGDRIAAGECGSLLRQLGATVVLVEPRDVSAGVSGKWSQRAVVAAGKSSLATDPDAPADRATLAALLDAADIVIASSDCQAPSVSSALAAMNGNAIVCDITAYGSSGPLAQRCDSDFLIQARAGFMDTTGAPEGAPTATAIPITEMAAAVYAAAGVIAALRVRRLQRVTQRVEIALFDCAVSMLTTFLPIHFVGREPCRIGNHHPSMSPWNAFRARDGWVLMCSGSDDQWRRVCDLLGRPELCADARYATPTKRMQVNSQIDDLVEAWTRERTVAECIERFNENSLACGPVYTIADLFTDPSLLHRRMFLETADPDAGGQLKVPGFLFGSNACRPPVMTRVPRRGEDRAAVEGLAATGRKARAAVPAPPATKPLEGLRVIEIGNYTTAPLAARQLAALGADVVKLEPPSGDASRALPPHRDGQGYFFTMSNAGKRSLLLDLRQDDAKAQFRELLQAADVLIENLRPGSLVRLGFAAAEITRINPRLVYCPISGFGADSPYADRAAMDTTIQAMSGIMDLTSVRGVPYKTGISCADLAGGQLGLAAILAALEFRDRTGNGLAMDLSMQDAAAWLTHLSWNRESGADGTLVRCADGYVAASADGARIAPVLNAASPDADGTVAAGDLTRAQVEARLDSAGIRSAPVLRVSEVATHEHTKARGLITTGRAQNATEWPLLKCAIQLTATPATVARAIGPLGADNDAVLHDWLGPRVRRTAARADTG